MAEQYILGKDLDKWEDSLATREPYNLSESETTSAQFMTGNDLMRSAKINSDWRKPIAIYSQAYSKYSPVMQTTESGLTAAWDELFNKLPANTFSDIAQSVLEGSSGFKTLAGSVSLLFDKDKRKKFREKLQEAFNENETSLNEAIDILNDRDYPIDKWAKRVIANSTATVENRNVVRELAKQAHGTDSKKWYNEAASIIGAMAPTLGVGSAAYKFARWANASRANAAKIAQNVAKGYVAVEATGQYAGETAAEYLRRTGDKTFENFTARDASGAMAKAYGIINAQIEFMGGVEPVVAGALGKVGLRSGLLKAGTKIGLGEMAEEGLQDVTELLMRKMEDTTDKTWAEGLTDALNGAVWGLFIGGSMGTLAFQSNRQNLVRGIKAVIPNIDDTEAKMVADAMIDNVAESASQDPTLRANLRQKVASLYRDIDLDNKEDRIDALTDLEYSLIAMDSADRGIELADHELFQGEVNELGWFRAGVPEAEREQIKSLNDNIVELRTQLEELNKAKEKDWVKIEEIENKLAQASQYVLEKVSDLATEFEKLERKYVAKQKKKAGIPADIITTPKQTSNHDYGDVKAENVIQESKDGKIYQYITDKQDGGRIRLLTNNGEIIGQIDIRRNGVGYIYVEPKYRRSKNAETLWKEAKRFINPEQVVASQRDDVKLEDTIKFWKKQGFVFGKGSRGTRKIDKTKKLESFPKRSTLMQSRVSGKGKDTYRGAYIPQFRFILRANKMDASTLSHELAHDWMEANFARYREGKMNKDFMKAWGALEKALGIPENATSVPPKASETFARAYEAWIVQNEDWAKLIAVDDKDKDVVEKLMKDYQNDLRDIYNDISNPYFKQTWGKLGELKPELKAWFDRVVNITDLDVMVERGEMTEEQASAEKLNRAIDTVIETTEDEETAQTLKEVRTLNDTSRYEVEGGSPNSIQRRLSKLAREIDENNMLVKGDKYDTRRDMLQVAEAADNFVKTRLDDALAIINGEMAEVEGLYKEDLYTALERLAVENGDLGLIDELKNSEVANRLAKELGQRVAGFRNFKQSTDVDVVSALKSLDIKFNKALDNKKAKQQYDSALKMLDESMKQQDKIADKELDNFLEELKCK